MTHSPDPDLRSMAAMDLVPAAMTYAEARVAALPVLEGARGLTSHDQSLIRNALRRLRVNLGASGEDDPSTWEEGDISRHENGNTFSERAFGPLAATRSDVRERLIRNLTNPDSLVAEAAAAALGEAAANHDDARAALLARANDARSPVRRVAAISLGRAALMHEDARAVFRRELVEPHIVELFVEQLRSMSLNERQVQGLLSMITEVPISGNSDWWTAGEGAGLLDALASAARRHPSVRLRLMRLAVGEGAPSGLMVRGADRARYTRLSGYVLDRMGPAGGADAYRENARPAEIPEIQNFVRMRVAEAGGVEHLPAAEAERYRVLEEEGLLELEAPEPADCRRPGLLRRTLGALRR